ncbi:uncharacterized protein TNCV_4602861 [Trichonephila clavipes]|nr:uncharacterized protein TNCV_4602861 [Trichonephila clavipes]
MYLLSRAVGRLVVRASDARSEDLEIVERKIEVVSPSIVPSGNFAELNRTVTCMVLDANDRRTSSPCHDELRGHRYDYVRQLGCLELVYSLRKPKFEGSIPAGVQVFSEFENRRKTSLAVLNHKILEANSQVQNVKLGGHQTCLSIIRLWHELCDMLRRLVGTTAPGHHDCSIQE